MRRIMGNRVRVLAAAGVLTAAGIAGAATVVNAQTPTPTPTQSAGSQQRTQMADAYITRLAQNLGVTPDRLRDALKQTALQEVDAAVARGDLTAQQAQTAKDRINSDEFGGFGFAFGRGGPGGPGGGHGIFVERDQLAQFLGITAEQLRTESEGKSLAQVAQAHGKTRDQLIQFIISSAQTRLAADMQAGRLTQQQADQRLADLRSKVGEMVDQVRQAGQRPRMTTGGSQ
jgi:hypothetical protein